MIEHLKVNCYGCYDLCGHDQIYSSTCAVSSHVSSIDVCMFLCCLFEILFRINEEVQDFSRYVLTALCFDVLVDWSPGLSLEFLRLCNIVVASCAGSEVC